MKIATGYLFDFVLRHKIVQMKLSKVIDLRVYAYFSEQKGTSHVYLSIIVDDGCVGPG